MKQENPINIRLLLKADIPGAMRLKNAEDWNQTEADWKMLLEHDRSLCLVAACGDQIVGTVTATNYGNAIAWIGMMLVDRDFRGQGLSKRLLGTVIDKLSDCRSIKLDATAKGLLVYEKLGFQVESLVDRLVTPALAGSLQIVRSGLVRPLSSEDIPEVAALDREAFGTNRTRLLKVFLQNNGAQAWGIERQGQLTGYVLGRPGTNYAHIGPLSAKNGEDAEALVAAALMNHVGKPVVLDILQDQEKLKAYLLSHGFSVQRSFVRMHLKERTLPTSPQKYFLIAGPELG